MSISRRNQRVAVYPYSAGDDGGYPSSGYGVARGTFFARVSPVVGNELTVAEQADHRERCVFEFDYNVPVAHDDMISDHRGAQWKVESIANRENAGTHTKIVRAVRSTDEPAVVPA